MYACIRGTHVYIPLVFFPRKRKLRNDLTNQCLQQFCHLYPLIYFVSVNVRCKFIAAYYLTHNTSAITLLWRPSLL